MQKQIEKLIKKSHDKIIRMKGKEYSPTALEIQNEINKSLTAVEWLVKEVNSDCLNSSFIRPELIKKAKAMEKEQIINADLNATIRTAKGVNADVSVTRVMELAEQYYTKTYNK